MFKSKRSIILYILFSFLPLILIAIFYSSLPQEIPMHWSFDGQMSFSNKREIWLVGILPVVLCLLFIFLPKLDPRKKNYERFSDVYTSFSIVVQLFMLVITGILLVEGFHPGTLSVEHIVIGAVGLLLVFFGNMLPKIKNNYFIGFRTPWSLSNSDVWNKTQRLGGYCFCLTGIVCLFLTVLPLSSEIRLGILLGALIITCILPMVMSCYWFQKLPKSQQKKPFVEIKPGDKINLSGDSEKKDKRKN